MIRLTYWAKRGRGEQIRLLLRELDVPYEDVHVARGGSFEALQAQGPTVLAFGSVPMLEDGSFRLCQGPAIMSYLARKHGMAPDDPQAAAQADALVLGAEDLRIRYFTLFGAEAEDKQRAFLSGPWTDRWLPAFEGLLEAAGGEEGFFFDRLSHADVAVWDVLDSILTWVPGASLADHPRLDAHHRAFRARPRIAAYLASDARPRG